MLVHVIVALVVGSCFGFFIASLMVAAKNQYEGHASPYTLAHLHGFCQRTDGESDVCHIWIRDQFGVFAGIIGEVAKDSHLEAAYSLESFRNYHENDYGKTWLAFCTRNEAERWEWA